MRARLCLDTKIVAQNFDAWRVFAGVPVRAVVKSNGYNWGFGALVCALDAACEQYCVADFDELVALRRHTRRSIVLLNSLAPGQLSEALDLDAIPTIGTREELSEVAQWASRANRKPRIRVGVMPAAGWSGIGLWEIEQLAAELAATQFEIEVWTHITDPAETRRLRSRVDQAVHCIRAHGGRVVATELASTYPLAVSGPMGDSVRVGVGLFGSSGGPAIPGVRCALNLTAPVVKREFLKAGTKVGYGETELGQDSNVLTVRCGYGDGLPKGLAGSSDILSVGMQYTVMRSPGEGFNADAVSLLDGRSDLDAFAAAARAGAHEIVTAFGNSKTSEHVLPED